jgi:hypothetical protein
MTNFALGIIVTILVIGAIWGGLSLRQSEGGGSPDGGSGHPNTPRAQ